MNGRARAIGSGLLVTATSLALVGVATAAADDAPSHPEAAHAAASRTGGSAGLRSVDPAVRAKNDQVVVQKFAAAVAKANADRWYAAVTANIERERAAVAARSVHRSSTVSSGNVLDCIRHRESRGQYDVVNSSSGAAGAYQFMPGTWNTNAAAAGRPDLVGVNPAAASPADQDAMAQHLLATQGLGP